jgi:FkbM family methyltransferase
MFSSIPKNFLNFLFHTSLISTQLLGIQRTLSERGVNTKSYNLVYDQPNILITEEAEKLGCAWNNGNVYDKPLINRFYSLLKNRTGPITVLDIGAQTGIFTLLSKFLPNSKWYAFEPIKEATDILQLNLRLNNIKNVEVYPYAISNRSGRDILRLPGYSELGLATLGRKPLRFNQFTLREIECLELDTFISEKNISKVDFIKIDTEGWEFFVLQGGKKMLTRDRPVILMEFNLVNMQQCGIYPSQIIELLNDLDYEWESLPDDIICIPK